MSETLPLRTIFRRDEDHIRVATQLYIVEAVRSGMYRRSHPEHHQVKDLHKVEHEVQRYLYIKPHIKHVEFFLYRVFSCPLLDQRSYEKKNHLSGMKSGIYIHRILPCSIKKNQQIMYFFIKKIRTFQPGC